MTDYPYWAVIPAAGTGVRVGSAIPKQYLPLAGKTVIEWAMAPFIADVRCRGVVVVIAADDTHWPHLSLTHAKVHITHGGAKRADSVLAGLHFLSANLHAGPSEWALVHDAARPCLQADDLVTLLSAVMTNASVGAILATPLVDTVKQANDDLLITGTIPRVGLWRAQTPQMFRIGMLRSSLQQALASGVVVTDEASAIEAAGLPVRLVEGRSDNVKITLPEDLLLAARILLAHRRGPS
jgi:2-C-methyl-D-erythritol 4-phosphate cytidylyltransferase